MVYSDLSPVLQLDIRSTENLLHITARSNLTLHSYHVTALLIYYMGFGNARTFLKNFLSLFRTTRYGGFIAPDVVFKAFLRKPVDYEIQYRDGHNTENIHHSRSE